MAGALGGCRAPETTQAPQEEPAALGAEVQASASAARLVRDLRRRFNAGTPTTASDEGLSLPQFIPSNTEAKYHVSSGLIRPRVAPGAEAMSRKTFAATADGWFRVDDSRSSLGLSFRMRGAAPSAAEAGEGYLVYGNAVSGGALLARSSEEGIEDYVVFQRRPAAPEVRYEIQLSSDVAGLRLVENTLEAVDAQGAPRLRIAPPFLVDASKARIDATLRVEGCSVDTNPAGPWGRPAVAAGADHCGVVVAWNDADVTYPAVLDPSWSSTQAMATARALHSTLNNNIGILAAGGLSVNGGVTKTAEMYNVSTLTWAATGSMATARYRHSGNFLFDGRLLVAGGYTTFNANPTNTAERYDPNTGKWTATANLATARASHTGTVLNTGEVLITGGSLASGAVTASVEIFNNNGNGAFRAGPALAQKRAFHAAAGPSLNGKVTITGGYDGTNSLASTELYDPTANSFSSGGNMAVSRWRHTAVMTPLDTVLVAGGWNTTGGTNYVTPSAELFDPNTVTWHRTADMVQQRRQHTATPLQTGSILVVGGFDNVGNPLASAELFNPYQENWADTLTAPSQARGFHTANDWGSPERVLIAGGSTTGFLSGTSSGLTSAELFNASFTSTVSAEYKFPAAVDPDVLSDRATELWARVYMPQVLTSGTRYPVLVFLHGNHNTCGHGSNPRIDDDATYTTTGTCPSGYVVTPNHEGYAYTAWEMAQRGYIVVSINANRGITAGAGVPGDDGLNLARGRLVLKHLQRLSEWDRGVSATPSSLGTSFQNHLDLTQVGFMGHSRGGEGVRAALSQFRASGSIWPGRIPNLNVRAIFEIGPVDGQTSQTLNATGVAWNVLLPMCDGDVSDLEGIKPFDRMLRGFTDSPALFKSTYTVWGACHNYFNTEWQQAEDFAACSGNGNTQLFSSGPGITGSPRQRQTAFLAMVHFFGATVGGSAVGTQARLFNPVYKIVPAEPRVDRGYAPSPTTSASKLLEDFVNATGTSSFNVPNNASNVTVTHAQINEHDPVMQGGFITWTSASSNNYFQTNWTNSGQSFDLSSWTYLDLRVERADDSAHNTAASTNFNIQFVHSDNSLSGAVGISSYLSLVGPVGSADGTHTMLQTARIPLTAFSGLRSNAVRGLRLVFNQTASGQVIVANIRATKAVPGQASAAPIMQAAAPADTMTTTAPVLGPGPFESSTAIGQAPPDLSVNVPAPAPRTVTAGNKVVALRSTGAGADVEIEVQSSEPLKGQNALLALRLADKDFTLSRYTSGDQRGVVFTIPRAAFDGIADGASMKAHYVVSSSRIEWDFGKLDKQQLR
jgi:hypothetical protein